MQGSHEIEGLIGEAVQIDVKFLIMIAAVKGVGSVQTDNLL